jgi:hypothetical protein
LCPLTLSKDETWGDVGDVVGVVAGDIFVLILVVRVRRRAMLIVEFGCWCSANVCVTVGYVRIGVDE